MDGQPGSQPPTRTGFVASHGGQHQGTKERSSSRCAFAGAHWWCYAAGGRVIEKGQVTPWYEVCVTVYARA